MSLKLYVDLMSQPSRALYILLKHVKYDKFMPTLVNLAKGEHYGDQFTAINRMQRVPVIDHNGFILTESVAIMKYLSRENIIPDNLFPKETKQRARVDEFLAWHHVGLRIHCAMYFRTTFLDPRITGTQPNPKTVESYFRRMENALQDFDTKWLGRGTDFITGNSITIADLMAACEVEQPRMAGYDPTEKYPNIAKWLPMVREYFNPHYQEAHVILNKVVAKQQKQTAKL
ncbi:glutathione S-transferase theta-1-like [Hyposmocoma kahamanoa]|uniref:glutathione S-transferase theta-1-like n=1 Tax=Hyposmocoma kahamanoa TaxID=1477025 RepID=UPI000E6D84B3|nr:glutathione S-transferase theta-1-like [Hyposmocoma kahamanoa]